MGVSALAGRVKAGILLHYELGDRRAVRPSLSSLPGPWAE